jgi:hypothetical protein
MQGGLSLSAAVGAAYHEGSENKGCPGMARVENVDPETFWSVVFRPPTGETPFAGTATPNSTARDPVQTRSEPDAGTPLKGWDQKERRLNKGVTLAYPTQ